jgi:hypothetical protein
VSNVVDLDARRKVDLDLTKWEDSELGCQVARLHGTAPRVVAMTCADRVGWALTPDEADQLAWELIRVANEARNEDIADPVRSGEVPA